MLLTHQIILISFYNLLQIATKLEFPAITFCNNNKFRKDRILEFANRYDIDSEMYLNYLTAAIDPNFIKLRLDMYGKMELIKLKQQFEYVQHKLPKNGEKTDLENLIVQSTSSLSQILLFSRDLSFWNGYTFEPITPDMFKTTLSLQGICYTFNSPENRKIPLFQADTNTRSGLHLWLKIDREQFTGR